MEVQKAGARNGFRHSYCGKASRFQCRFYSIGLGPYRHCTLLPHGREFEILQNFLSIFQEEFVHFLAFRPYLPVDYNLFYFLKLMDAVKAACFAIGSGFMAETVE